MSSEPRKSFLLRLDPRLWRELEGWAKDEFRSINGQIEYLLKQAVQKHRRPLPEPSAPATVLPDTQERPPPQAQG